MKLESELEHNGVHEANIKSSRTVRRQMLEAESEAKDKSSRPRPRPRTKCWPRGQLGLEDLTSLMLSDRLTGSLTDNKASHENVIDMNKLL